MFESERRSYDDDRSDANEAQSPGMAGISADRQARLVVGEGQCPPTGGKPTRRALARLGQRWVGTAGRSSDSAAEPATRGYHLAGIVELEQSSIARPFHGNSCSIKVTMKRSSSCSGLEQGSVLRPATRGPPRPRRADWLGGDVDGGCQADIMVMHPDGSDIRKLTTNPGRYFGPTWSPDGSTIAFAASSFGGKQSFVINPDGTGERQITRTGCGELSPSWTARPGRP